MVVVSWCLLVSGWCLVSVCLVSVCLVPGVRWWRLSVAGVAVGVGVRRNVLEGMDDTLGRDDDDDFLDEEPKTAQHLQALKEGAAGRSGAGVGAGAGAMAVNTVANNKAVRVEQGYVRGLYR